MAWVALRCSTLQGTQANVRYDMQNVLYSNRLTPNKVTHSLSTRGIFFGKPSQNTSTVMLSSVFMNPAIEEG
jgi:hypothetical protein